MNDHCVEEMIVKNYMKRGIIALSPEDSVEDALDLLKKHDLCQAPVVKNGKVIGIVKDKNLLSVLEEPLCVNFVTTSEFITIPEDSSIIQAAQMICRYKLDALPVISDTGELVGMLTTTDILKGLHTLRGDFTRETEQAEKI